jgi:parallel beta-helix repeat protein
MTKYNNSFRILSFTFLIAVSAVEVTYSERKQPIETGRKNTTYYISAEGDDSADGHNPGYALRTFARANSIAKPGDTFLVLDGTYSVANGSSIDLTSSGSPDAYITYKAANPYKARIGEFNCGADTRENCALLTMRGSYIIVQGFDIDGSATTSSHGIFVYGDHVRILENKIHDTVPVCARGLGGAGISSGSYTNVDTEVIGNVIYRNRLTQQCPVPPKVRGQGVYLASSGGGIVANNLIIDNGGDGIHFAHAASRYAIINNTVLNNGNRGMVITASDAPAGAFHSADYFLVANNIFAHNKSYGIYEARSSSAGGKAEVGTHNLYSNNLFYSNNTADLNSCPYKNKNTNNWCFEVTGRAASSLIDEPRFVRYTGDSRGDYRLKSSSPGVAKGATCLVRADGTRFQPPEVDGNGLKRGVMLSIGAFEPAPVQPERKPLRNSANAE